MVPITVPAAGDYHTSSQLMPRIGIKGMLACKIRMCHQACNLQCRCSAPASGARNATGNGSVQWARHCCSTAATHCVQPDGTVHDICACRAMGLSALLQHCCNPLCAAGQAQMSDGTAHDPVFPMNRSCLSFTAASEHAIMCMPCYGTAAFP